MHSEPTQDDPDSQFAGLGLRAWPFQLVPLAGATDVWYARAVLRADLDRLMWRLGRQEYSTLHLLWADVGSGKTHTLRYLERLAREYPGRSMVPIYAVMPRRPRGFVDLYATVAKSFDLALAADCASKLVRDGGSRAVEAVLTDWPDLYPALVLYQSGTNTERDLVRRWVTASRDVRRADLVRAGISREIRTSDHAVAALTALSQLVLSSNNRLIVLLDEMQRIGTVRGAIANEMSAGLHTWYNAVPSGLTMILTFSFGDQSHIAAHVTPELLSRVDHQRLEMRPLDREDAVTFVEAALEANRLPNATGTAMTSEHVSAVVGALAPRAVLSPRNVMKAFDAVLTEMDFRINTGDGEMSAKDATAMIEGLQFDAEDAD